MRRILGNRHAAKVSDPRSHWPSTGVALASIASSAILAGLSMYFSSQGLRKDYVQLAVSILKEAPADTPKELREWAVTLLAENSPVELNEAAKAALRSERLLAPAMAPSNLQVR
jgi:hypothetical protein